MTICRRHPALGWLALQGSDTQKTLSKLLYFRDMAEANDSQHSGMPPGFLEWSLTEQLPALVRQPFYRNQLQERIQVLQKKSESISSSIQQIVGGLIEQQSETDSEIHQLSAILEEQEI